MTLALLSTPLAAGDLEIAPASLFVATDFVLMFAGVEKELVLL